MKYITVMASVGLEGLKVFKKQARKINKNLKKSSQSRGLF